MISSVPSLCAGRDSYGAGSAKFQAARNETPAGAAGLIGGSFGAAAFAVRRARVGPIAAKAAMAFAAEQC
jgi:hypothetical protein